MLLSRKWKQNTNFPVVKNEVESDEEEREKPKEEKPDEENIKEKKPEEKPKGETSSFADLKDKISSSLHLSAEIRLIAVVAACFWVLRYHAVLESRIASVEAGLEKLSTEFSGNNGLSFPHLLLEILQIVGLATVCVLVLRRLTDLQLRIGQAA